MRQNREASHVVDTGEKGPFFFMRSLLASLCPKGVPFSDSDRGHLQSAKARWRMTCTQLVGSGQHGEKDGTWRGQNAVAGMQS